MKNKENEILTELDLVVSNCPIKNLPIGTMGTIVHDYGENETFEVEFFQNNQTISVETVSKNQIQKPTDRDKIEALINHLDSKFKNDKNK